jgi:transposase
LPKKRKRSRYTSQFKEEALRAVATRGSRTIAEVAEGLGVPEQLLHSWKSRAKTLNTPNDRGETLEEEVRRLRRELADVKKDRDVLVKSIAVFVKERK